MEFRTDADLVVSAREEEGYVPGLQFARDREDHLAAEIHVEHGGIQDAAIVQDPECVIEIAHRPRDICAERATCPANVVREKIFVLDNEDPPPAERRQRS